MAGRVRVSQATIDAIKRRGMQANLDKIKQGGMSEEETEGMRRMYPGYFARTHGTAKKSLPAKASASPSPLSTVATQPGRASSNKDRDNAASLRGAAQRRLSSSRPGTPKNDDPRLMRNQTQEQVRQRKDYGTEPAKPKKKSKSAWQKIKERSTVL